MKSSVLISGIYLFHTLCIIISIFVHNNSCWQAVLAFNSIGIFKYLFLIIVHKNCSLDMISCICSHSSYIFYFFFMQYTHAYRHTYMQTYKHLCLYMQYALACMHACRHTNMYAYTCIMHLHACRHSSGNTHMQCHAHNIFFSVNMCNIYFLILIYLIVQFKCI